MLRARPAPRQPRQPPDHAVCVHRIAGSAAGSPWHECGSPDDLAHRPLRTNHNECLVGARGANPPLRLIRRCRGRQPACRAEHAQFLPGEAPECRPIARLRLARPSPIVGPAGGTTPAPTQPFRGQERKRMLAPRLKGFLRSDRVVLWRRRLTRLAGYGTAALSRGCPPPAAHYERRSLPDRRLQPVLRAGAGAPGLPDLEAGHLHQPGANGRRPGSAVPASFQRRCRRADPVHLREYRPVRAHLHPGDRVRAAHPAVCRGRRLFRRPRPRAAQADPGPHRRRPGAAPHGLGLVHAGDGPCCTRSPTSWTTSTSRPW